MGKQWKQWLTLFLELPKSLQMVIAAMKLKDACSSLKEIPRQNWPDLPRFKIGKTRQGGWLRLVRTSGGAEWVHLRTDFSWAMSHSSKNHQIVTWLPLQLSKRKEWAVV